MANLTEKTIWETGIYQLETADPVEGGAEGKSNQQAKQLANRTAWLKAHIMPVGSLIIWPTSTPPAGYLECDGAALSRTTYAALFAVLGTTYGQGAGTQASTTFRLPDLRGEFIRGWDHGRGADANRTIGSAQSATRVYRNNSYPDGFQNSMLDGDHLVAADHDGSIESVNAPSQHSNRSMRGPRQTVAGGKISGIRVRPRNIAMMYAIKY